MNSPFLVANILSPELVVPVIIFMIPIVAILAHHQQKMAQILHGRNQSNEIGDLRREVADLRNLVQRQLYTNGSLHSGESSTTPIETRLQSRAGMDL